MKVLVTGAAGFIGSVVTDKLLEAGHTVVGFDSLKYGHRAAVNPAADFVQGDLRDRALVAETLSKHNIEGVMHLAAEAYIEESMTDPGLYFDVNTFASTYMLDEMIKLGIKRIVFSSTAAVYGEPRTLPIKEDAVKDPVNTYGESKLQFETVLNWYRKIYGLNYVTFRYFNACGATQTRGEHRKKETHIIPILLEAAEGKRDVFNLFGTDYNTKDGTCVRDYVHVADIADAHLMAFNKIDELGAKQYNLSSNAGVSNREMVIAAKEVTGVDFKVVDSPRRPGDPATLIATHELIHQDLNWSPKYTDVKEMIESSWKWRKSNPKGYAE